MMVEERKSQHTQILALNDQLDSDNKQINQWQSQMDALEKRIKEQEKDSQKIALEEEECRERIKEIEEIRQGNDMQITSFDQIIGQKRAELEDKE